MEHQIIVGNIGTVYSGSNHRTARTKYRTYIEQSKSERGRAGSEDVTWLIDGEIHMKYIGTLEHD